MYACRARPVRLRSQRITNEGSGHLVGRIFGDIREDARVQSRRGSERHLVGRMYPQVAALGHEACLFMKWSEA